VGNVVLNDRAYCCGSSVQSSGMLTPGRGRQNKTEQVLRDLALVQIYGDQIHATSSTSESEATLVWTVSGPGQGFKLKLII
jgi:hypothetical protein